MAAKQKRRWWKVPLTVLGWIAAAGVYYAFSDEKGILPVWLYVVIAVLAFNYATATIMDKLDAILWRLEDVERRLPDTDPYL
jgi:hypothetical protein